MPKSLRKPTDIMLRLQRVETFLYLIAHELRCFYQKPPQKLDKSKQTQHYSKEISAHIIQQFWRKYKTKRLLKNKPYEHYLSWVPQNDKYRKLHEVMFGRHQAEFNSKNGERFNNPYIFAKAFYHRDDDLNPLIRNALKERFKLIIPVKNMIPVSLIDSYTIEEFLATHFPLKSSKVVVLRNENFPIALVLSSLSQYELTELKKCLRATGLIASPWAIAQTIHQSAVLPDSDKTQTLPAQQFDSLQHLMRSGIITKIKKIAASQEHVALLARSILNLLNDTPYLSSAAVERVTALLEQLVTFHAYDYSMMSFCIYTLIHEITISMLDSDSAQIEREFSAFEEEAQTTLLSTLNLSVVPDNMSVVAYPALSGTNAYAIALKIANTMRHGSEPLKTHQVKSRYYEFAYVTPQVKDADDIDIYAFSAGPISEEEGVVPGVDINDFKRNVLMLRNTEKPVTLVVDITSAQYSSLNLDLDVQEYIQKAHVSIIFNESRQKFGMIHSDQPQYGRTFGLCSDKCYSFDELQCHRDRARRDFARHVDLRIGAYISVRCADILEAIKDKHFRNGRFMTEMLHELGFSQSKKVPHLNMRYHQDQEYFYVIDMAEARPFKNVIPWRDSFGHFATTLSRVYRNIRLSADASDLIDQLILVTQVFLKKEFEPSELIAVFNEYLASIESPTIDQQILLVSIALRLTGSASQFLAANENQMILKNIKKALDLCDDLAGRTWHKKAVNNYYEIKRACSHQDSTHLTRHC